MDNIVLEKKEFRKKIKSHLSQLEENYFKDALDVEKNRLNAPTFVKVEKGEMTMYHINTVDTHVLNENMVLPPLSDTELKELKDILNKFFN